MDDEKPESATVEVDAARPGVLVLAVKCLCGAVYLSVERDGIDKLSHGGTGSIKCQRCGLFFLVWSPPTGLAEKLLPGMLPDSETEFLLTTDHLDATGGDAN